MLALQDLGRQLAAMPESRLARLPLGDTLRDALAEHARIRASAHEARRRQMQLIGKLMRDENAEAIATALEADRDRDSARVLRLQQATSWRDALVRGDRHWSDFVEQFPHAPDLAELAALARDERSAGRPPHRQRELYRRLQQFLTGD